MKLKEAFGDTQDEIEDLKKDISNDNNKEPNKNNELNNKIKNAKNIGELKSIINEIDSWKVSYSEREPLYNMLKQKTSELLNAAGEEDVKQIKASLGKPTRP
jgi:hypothetical protein